MFIMGILVPLRLTGGIITSMDLTVFSSSVGAPVDVQKVTNPSQEQVDELHACYVQKLEELFTRHRDSFGVPKTTKLIIT